MMSEQETIQFLKQVKKVNFSAEKKVALREKLLVFMEANPLPQKVGGIWADHFFDIFTVKRFISSGMIAVLCALLASGGISFAAEKALPGEPLYSVKRNVNEPMREVVAFTPQAKANWAVEQMRRRIAEAEELSLQGRLSDDHRKNIEDDTSRSVEQVNKLVQNLRLKSDTAKAFQVEKDSYEALHGGKKIRIEIVSNGRVTIYEREENNLEK